MITQTVNYRSLIAQLPPDSTLVLHGISWEEYEELLHDVGEAGGLRISYDRGRLQIMTLSSAHEHYVKLIERMVDRLSIFLRIKILFYGSATMKRRQQFKGAEPDACFYIQHAEAIGKKEEIDFGSDPPPDIVVEVDLHHESLSKFPIYAALGVPEIWRYDGAALSIHLLRENDYAAAEESLALPLLSAGGLSQFLSRSRNEDQYETLLAFESWLDSQKQ